jgi:hypothetical protein
MQKEEDGEGDDRSSNRHETMFKNKSDARHSSIKLF